jgi:glycosyltransferase involved in cell wall biosynthesis
MTTDTVGGVWIYALELARALSKKGIQTILAGMGAPATSKQRQEAQRIPHLELCESSFKLEWMEDPWQDVKQAGQWLLQLEKQFEPDLVHLNGYAHGALSWRAPTLVVGHSCVLSWWQAVKGEAAPENWDQYRHQVRRGLRAADMVVAPTQAMLAALEEHYGPLAKRKVIANSRDAALFRPGKKEPFIFAAGRLWDEAKNIMILEQVAPALAWPVYVAGNNQHPTGRMVEFSHLRLLGCLPAQAIAPLFGRASIYALPARYEPFGLSALEAALAGCALVLGDIPSLREVWGEAALYTPPDDPKAIEDALQLLIKDAAYRHELAARARLRALKYTTQRMADHYLAIYQELVYARELV